MMIARREFFRINFDLSYIILITSYCSLAMSSVELTAVRLLRGLSPTQFTPSAMSRWWVFALLFRALPIAVGHSEPTTLGPISVRIRIGDSPHIPGSSGAAVYYYGHLLAAKNCLTMVKSILDFKVGSVTIARFRFYYHDCPCNIICQI